MKPDADIKRDVEDELRWPHIDATDIAVAAKNGVVTLTGFVHSYTRKIEAEDAAKRVAGVVGLANDIEVRLPGVDARPDPEIARDAVRAIEDRLPLVGTRIKPIVSRGWVTLEGEVEWNFERDMAEKAVRRLRGIKGVSNMVHLKPRAVPTPSEIKQKIEAAFRRSAQFDADHITVETVGAEVVLKGTVRSWHERDQAERAAWAAPGIVKVDDRITVRA